MNTRLYTLYGRAGIREKAELFTGLTLVLLLLWALVPASPLLAADPVHKFDCANCHRGSVSATALTNNLCLDCHDEASGAVTMADGSSKAAQGRFVVGDASNLFNHNSVQATDQSSHNWGAPEDAPAAGAQAPSNRLFNGRMGYSRGYVSCSRCHNPHDYSDTNPKLIKLSPGMINPLTSSPYTTEDLCLDCHRGWNQSGNRGLETHPMVADYAATVAGKLDRYKATPASGGAAGGVQLVDGGVSCSSCHAPHFADSDGSTVDGIGQPLNQGDGRLLRADGPAGDASALCQACHNYSAHGDNSGEQPGCQVCHAGHVYDEGGQPNYFILRQQTTTTRYGAVSGLVYNDPKVLDPAEKFTFWNDQVSGTAEGYCEKCHGDAETIGSGAGKYHVASAICTDCHSHAGADGAFSFSANCNGCHAYPPAWNSHPAHTAGAKMAKLDCKACHATSAHLNDLSEVRFDSANDSRLVGATYSDQGGNEGSRFSIAGGYAATPAYGQCANLYCHSNAAPFDGSQSYKQPTWGSSGNGCGFCHDTGGSATGLSGRHGRHTDAATYAIDCSSCHAATVSDSSSISDPTKHIDQQKEVSFAAGIGGSYAVATRVCGNTYCHSDGRGGAPNRTVKWSDSAPTTCADCHNGRIGDSSEMLSNAHDRLASSLWIRKYPCEYCHAGTVNASGQIVGFDKHVNQTKDVIFESRWSISGKPAPTYNSATMVCENIYCHSDGTTVDPEVRDFPWDKSSHADCNTCHGHPDGQCSGCHTDGRTAFPPEEQWKSAMPMYANQGPGTARANSHLRHLQTDFSCENCHAATVVGSCQTAGCHDGGVPTGDMTEVGHVNADFHVNKHKDVVFKDGGSYDPSTKRCSNTVCHSGSDPQWGDSRDNEVLCLTCHGTTEPDVDDFGSFNGTRAKINMTEWVTSGHGRPATAGNYTSGNPPANFPGNPCWYCHDQDVLHKTPDNPFRLKKHPQFEQRFEKECVFCHMEGKDSECRGCHTDSESLAPQLSTVFPPTFSIDHRPFDAGGDSCTTASCHPDDANRHKTGAGVWSPEQKQDVQNQYVMIGVCLQCHDDDSNDRCNQCHTWSGAPEDNPYRLGYDPGTGFIAGSSKAASTHFGYKHMARYNNDGTWGGGKFCWDCHDPHGDKNIYMIQDQVATETDGTFGVPQQRAAVSFTRTLSGMDYARSMPPYDGICNVCHQNTNHYQNDHGDSHRSGRRCTKCHEHSFSAGHASGQSCKECHLNRPEPSHLGFGQARDCTKCHDGVINQRMDVMRQFRGQSHHVQGQEVSNRNCYACHWESTPEGLINRDHHQGYNNKTHTSQSNAPVDLVIWEAGKRPEVFTPGVTETSFEAQKIGTVEERSEISKLTGHCLGCHSDQNNTTEPFGDCKTPTQYAWDGTSVGARYGQTGTAVLGKYQVGSFTANKSQTKAYSAHGNAVANQGGWVAASGEDAMSGNTRDGSENVQCFDCHSSHGSYTSGITSSYVTFDGTHGGANLKETQAGKGGYSVTYRAAAETSALSDLSPGAAQCFDCHETRNAGEKPWGFESTFGASEPIQGYRDSSRFSGGDNGVKQRWDYRSGKTGVSGHFSHLSPALDNSPVRQVNGLCAGCHDPHGVSPTLGDDQKYGVPMLKGTWLSSPYKEDSPQTNLGTGISANNVQIDRKAFNDLTNRTHITETPAQFAGLCLSCHPKQNLTNGEDKSQPWGSRDRIHQSVKGWGSNSEHQYPCSKCHQPHSAGLPRLMRTNCLDWKHRGNVESGGPTPGWRSETEHFPRLRQQWQPCHQSSGARGGVESNSNYKDQSWNQVTPW